MDTKRYFAALLLGLTLSLFASLTPNAIRGQTWRPTGGEWFASACYAGGSYWVVAQTGKLLTSSDGKGWREVRHLLDQAGGVLFRDASNGIICGIDATGNIAFEKTTNEGKTWALTHSEIPQAQRAIARFDGSDTILTAGNGGVIMRSTNDGISWVRSATGTSNPLFACGFGSSTVAYASSDSGRLLRSTDAGATWSMMQVPGASDLWGLAALSDSMVLVGDNFKNVYRSSDAGATWTSNRLKIQIFALSQQFGISRALGVSGSARVQYHSLDSGQSWVSEYDSDRYDISDIYIFMATAAANQNEAIRVGNPGLIQRTSDGGKTWSTVASSLMHRAPSPLSEFTVGHFIDSLHGFVFCNSTRFMQTSDAGITWLTRRVDSTLPGLFASDFNDVHFFGSDTAVVVGSLNGLYQSTDRGNHWRNLQKGITGSYIGCITGDSSGKGYICVDSSIFSSSDRGTTWSHDTTLAVRGLGALSFPTKDTGFVLVSRPNGIYLLRSINSGQSWIELPLDPSILEGANAYCFRSGSEAYIGKLGGTIVHTNDCFQHCDSVHTSHSGYFFDFLFLSDSVGYVSGDSLSILSTHDAGKSWRHDSVDKFSYQGETGSESLRRLCRAGQNKIFAVGDENIFVLDLAPEQQAAVKQKPHAGLQNIVISASPNPAMNSATIALEGLSNITSGNQRLTLRDLLGREVLDLTPQFVRKAGSSNWSVTFDLSALSSGAYIISYEGSQGNASATMVVAK